MTYKWTRRDMKCLRAFDEAMTLHFDCFVRAFVNTQCRLRYLSLLETEKGRAQILHNVESFPFEEAFMEQVSLQDTNWKLVFELLRAKGAPETCCRFCGAVEHCGPANLEEAVEAAFSRDTRFYGLVLSCVPGRLAYHESESAGPNCRVILSS